MTYMVNLKSPITIQECVNGQWVNVGVGIEGYLEYLKSDNDNFRAVDANGDVIQSPFDKLKEVK